MTANEQPLVLVASDRPEAAVALNDGAWRVDARPLSPEQVLLDDASVLVVDGQVEPPRALWFLRTLTARYGDDCPPVMALLPTVNHVDGFQSGADVCLTAAANPDELHAQVRSLIRWHQVRARLRSRSEELSHANGRLQQAYAQINLDLDIARRLQQSFLPVRLPEVGQVRFAVHYRPLGPVGGDFYDVFRLDERRVGFYVADVMGHGVPASLLTVYLKKAVVGKEIVPGGYRLLPPDEVLAQLNCDLIAQELPDLPFVTMTYGVVDTFSGDVSLARAAQPQAVLLPANGEPEVWPIPGTLLGVFDAGYETRKRRLMPGERMVLMTDGLATGDQAAGSDAAGVLAAIRAVRGVSLDKMVSAFADNRLQGRPPTDDVTVMVLEYGV